MRLRLKEVREGRKLSQQALAEKSFVSQSAISYIEKGKKSPTLDTLELLAKALAVPVWELLEEE